MVGRLFRYVYTFSDIENLVQRCPLLDEVDMSDSSDITGLGYDMLIGKLAHLRVLSVSRCYSIDPTVFL